MTLNAETGRDGLHASECRLEELVSGNSLSFICSVPSGCLEIIQTQVTLYRKRRLNLCIQKHLVFILNNIMNYKFTEWNFFLMSQHYEMFFLHAQFIPLLAQFGPSVRNIDSQDFNFRSKQNSPTADHRVLTSPALTTVYP